jgi:hypothetical protein
MPVPDPLVMRLNMLEESICHNHETLTEAMRWNYEESLGRLAELHNMYERQLERQR